MIPVQIQGYGESMMRGRMLMLWNTNKLGS